MYLPIQKYNVYLVKESDSNNKMLSKYTPKKKDPGTWVFRFRTFNLNHSWILSQLSYERVLYIKSFV